MTIVQLNFSRIEPGSILKSFSSVIVVLSKICFFFFNYCLALFFFDVCLDFLNYIQLQIFISINAHICAYV